MRILWILSADEPLRLGIVAACRELGLIREATIGDKTVTLSPNLNEISDETERDLFRRSHVLAGIPLPTWRPY